MQLYLPQGLWEAEVYMQDFKDEKNLSSVRITVEKHKDLIPSPILLHSLSRCDTVPNMFGIGKAKALSAVRKCLLQFLSQENTNITEAVEKVKRFEAQC